MVSKGPEQLLELTFPRFKVTFSNHGAALKHWVLLDPKFARDRTTGGHLVAEGPQTGAFVVNFANGDGMMSNEVLPTGAEWKAQQSSPTQLTYEYQSASLKLTKTFTIDPDTLTVRMSLAAAAVGAQPLQQTLAVSSFGLAPQLYRETKKGGRRAGTTDWLAACKRTGAGATRGYEKLVKAPWKVPGVRWGGFRNTYLMAVMAPKVAAGEAVSCNAYPVPGQPLLMELDLIFPTVVLRPGEAPVVREVVGYFGPSEYDALRAADASAGFSPSPGMHAVVDFGWFGFIGKPLHWLMVTFHGLTGNWGLAIILLTIVVKLATLYWTTKSVRSMKAMAAVAPKMKELQTKYADNPQKLRVETMALYQQYGVNPLSGCLPIFLQMPIWIGLYRMLSSSGELYLEPLIGGWINDLSDTDPVYVLPVLLIVTMFAQAKLTPQTGQTGMQQKLLMYGLPLGFGIASFFFPAGLTLYIFTNTLLSAAHSIYMNKFDRKSKEMAAKIAAAVAGDGDAPSTKSDAKSDAKSDGKGDDDAPAGGASTGPKRPRNESRGGKNKRRR